MKVLIFYASAGGGHKSAARTIAREVQRLGHEAKIVDGLAGQPMWFQELFKKSYSLLTDSLPWFWRLVFWISDQPKLNSWLIWPLLQTVEQDFEQTIRNYEPDQVVSVYYWTSVLKKTLSKLNSKSKLQTVVTDKFTPSKIWFLEPKSKYLVFSKRAKKIALECQIEEKQVEIFHDIVDNKFNNPLSSAKIVEFKEEEGFKIDVPLVLIAGGGESLPNGVKIVRELLEHNISAQFAVVCGRNQTLKEKIEKMALNYPKTSLKIYGFVDFMYKLMNSADLIITKAGPATVMEALLLGKPLILSHYYWRQELGNVEFVENNNLGFYEPSPKKLAELAREILSEKSRFEGLHRNIQKINLKTDPQGVSVRILESRF